MPINKALIRHAIPYDITIPIPITLSGTMILSSITIPPLINIFIEGITKLFSVYKAVMADLKHIGMSYYE